jgi:hypothetical protein
MSYLVEGELPVEGLQTDNGTRRTQRQKCSFEISEKKVGRRWSWSRLDVVPSHGCCSECLFLPLWPSCLVTGVMGTDKQTTDSRMAGRKANLGRDGDCESLPVRAQDEGKTGVCKMIISSCCLFEEVEVESRARLVMAQSRLASKTHPTGKDRGMWRG